MGKKISLCKCNERYEELKRELKKDINDNVQITENMCIGACNLCGYKYIARVDGVLVESEDLYEALKIVKLEVRK